MESTEIKELVEYETIDDMAEVVVVEESEITTDTEIDIETIIGEYAETRADYTETLAIIQQNTAHIGAIASDVRVLVVVVLLTFCWSCMRSWRTHVMKGGK